MCGCHAQSLCEDVAPKQAVCADVTRKLIVRMSRQSFVRGCRVKVLCVDVASSCVRGCLAKSCALPKLYERMSRDKAICADVVANQYARMSCRSYVLVSRAEAVRADLVLRQCVRMSCQSCRCGRHAKTICANDALKSERMCKCRDRTVCANGALRLYA